MTLPGDANTTPNAGHTSTTATINDDDDLPTLSIADISQTEGNTNKTVFTFTVTLSAPSGREVQVNFATQEISAAGNATKGVDYEETSGTITFAAGTTTQTIRFRSSRTSSMNLSLPKGSW